jgi:plastocyanin
MLLRFFFALAFFAAIAGCGQKASTPPEKATVPNTAVIVEMRAMQFSPASLEIKKGDTVEWKNNDLVPHTATSASFDSGSIGPGQSWKHTFNEQGDITYKCTFHPAMKGSVTVR